MHPQCTARQIARFWSHVRTAGPSECWLWTRARNKTGYGFTAIGRQKWLAHRLAWTITNGPIPQGLNVLHRCDTPLCCNPSHLFVGTQADNITDMCQKGRHAIVPGERYPNAKLTPSLVREIRQRYARGGITQAALAARYGVNVAQIARVVTYQAWRHVPSEDAEPGRLL